MQDWHKYPARIMLAAIACLGCCMAGAEESRYPDSRPDLAGVANLITDTWIINYAGIDAPIDKIVLIRNGHSRCAIRYRAFSRAHDGKPATAFTSGGESYSGEAEFWKESDKHVVPLKLTWVATTGFAKLVIFDHSHNRLRCGAADLSWAYPTATIIVADDDHETWLAPTNLEDFGKLDFDDAGIRWYRRDVDRKIQFLKLSDVWPQAR